MQTLWLNLVPTAINDIEWKFYLVFVVLSACGAVYVYFLIPGVSCMTYRLVTYS